MINGSTACRSNYLASQAAIRARRSLCGAVATAPLTADLGSEPSSLEPHR